MIKGLLLLTIFLSHNSNYSKLMGLNDSSFNTQIVSLIMAAKKISFAIVGGGPAAFYSAKLLAKLPCEPIIHVIEKQLCPFGLIRYGVAPDHLSIKKSEIILSEAAQNPHFKYFGNASVSSQTYEKLKDIYSGVISAYGASANSELPWLKSTHSSTKYAREIVYWYNGHPQQEITRINLSTVKNVAIIGNGNVAIDIARIFLRKPEQLISSQISQLALTELKQSNIRNVQIIARRGVTYSAFSIKEVRELHRLGIPLYAVQQQLEESMTEASTYECTAIGDHFNSIVRMNKRKVDFIKANFRIIKEDEIERTKEQAEKKIIFRYLLSPQKLSASDFIVCQKNKLEGEAFKQYSVPKQGEKTTVHFDLLVISAGFQVSPLVEGYYDSTKKHLNHSHGCLIKDDKIDVGAYAVGWCKNGAKGVIDETLLSCEQTFNNIRIHLNNNLLMVKNEPMPSTENTVSFNRYLELREVELSRGIKQKFIKKKLPTNEIIQFYNINCENNEFDCNY